MQFLIFLNLVDARLGLSIDTYTCISNAYPVVGIQLPTERTKTLDD